MTLKDKIFIKTIQRNKQPTPFGSIIKKLLGNEFKNEILLELLSQVSKILRYVPVQTERIQNESKVLHRSY